MIITGSDGFIGSNLINKLKTNDKIDFIALNREFGDIAKAFGGTQETEPKKSVPSSPSVPSRGSSGSVCFPTFRTRAF